MNDPFSSPIIWSKRMASRKVKFIWAILITLIATTTLTYLIRILFFPSRPMFHNYLTSIGEKSLVRIWIEPPVRVNTRFTQEMFIDSHLNIMVVLEISPNHEKGAVGDTPERWTGHAYYGQEFTSFKYNGHQHKIDRNEKDMLVILSPQGEKWTSPIMSGQASMWHEAFLKESPDDFIVGLKKMANSNSQASKMIDSYLSRG